MISHPHNLGSADQIVLRPPPEGRSPEKNLLSISQDLLYSPLGEHIIPLCFVFPGLLFFPIKLHTKILIKVI